MTLKEKTANKVLRFIIPIIVEPDEDKFYAHSPALSGLMVGGDSREEALQNARDGSVALLHSMIRDNEPIPLCLTSGTALQPPKMTVNEGKFYFQEEIKVSI